MSKAWKYPLPGTHRRATSFVLVESKCKLINHKRQEENNA